MEIISIEAPNDSREVSTFRVEEGVADVFPTDLESVGLPKISRALSEVSSGIMLSRDMQSSDILDCSGHQRVPARRKFSLHPPNKNTDFASGRHRRRCGSCHGEGGSESESALLCAAIGTENRPTRNRDSDSSTRKKIMIRHDSGSTVTASAGPVTRRPDVSTGTRNIRVTWWLG